MKKFFKNLLQNHWSEFEIISQDCSVPCVTLFKKCSRNFDPSKNMAAVGGRLFSKSFSSETTCLISK